MLLNRLLMLIEEVESAAVAAGAVSDACDAELFSSKLASVNRTAAHKLSEYKLSAV